MMKFYLGIAFLAISALTVYGTDYCKLCSGKNIGCNATNKILSPCPSDAEIYNFNSTEIDYILHLHNDYRNAICNGSITGYSKCKQMAKLTWSTELAYLAGLNTRNCTFAHDKCRNTDQYKQAGQNIASVSRWKRYPTAFEAIYQIVHDLWFLEYKNANMTYIKSYKDPSNSSLEFGHFTQVLMANATTVGCGVTKYYHNGYGRYYMACDYALGNTYYCPVYLASDTAGSGCKTGTDSTYKALCTVNETLNPNYYF